MIIIVILILKGKRIKFFGIIAKRLLMSKKKKKNCKERFKNKFIKCKKI